MNYFIGIDIGTTHTKAVVTGDDGTLFFEAKKGYDLLRPQPGYEEQDVDVIMNIVTDLLRQSIAAVSSEETIAAVGFSAAMHSLLPVDENGTPLYNAITWADTRSRKEAETILQHTDTGVLYANTGIPVHPMSPLCKIVWFREQSPSIFAKTEKFISIKEYIFYKLTGKYLVDHSLAAATGLFNIYEKKWDAVALQIAGIDENKLSQPVPTVHAEHALTPFYTELFSLRGMVPFIIGASDGCLANLGSGAVMQGETALTIGTSGAVRMTLQSLPDPGIQDKERLFIYPLAADLYVRGGAINNGGIVLGWLANLLLPDGEATDNYYEKLLSLAAQASPGADGLVFLPYLLGERAPVWDADAKGVLVGLGIRHRKEQVTRAALEGICFILYQILQKLESAHGAVKEIYASGGFVQSGFWVQLIADITGKKIRVREKADASAAGAAWLAMYATGYLKNLQEVKQFVRDRRVYEPDTNKHEVYARLFPVFNSLYGKLKDDFAALSRLQEN